MSILIEEWREYLYKNFVAGPIMTTLSKTFDCIPQDLVIAKVEAYGLGEKALSYIYSYLTNRNQCVRINDEKVTSKRKFLCPLRLHTRTNPFNFLINDLFFSVSSASIYNFADDSSLSAAAKTVTKLRNTLHSESEVIINSFKNNEMIVNSEISQAIILDKQKMTIQLRLSNSIITHLRLCLLSHSQPFT